FPTRRSSDLVVPLEPFRLTIVQDRFEDVGQTHDSKVKAVVRSNDDVGVTCTLSSTPSSNRPCPYRPGVVHTGPFMSAAVLPLPLTSAVVMFVPSLNEYAATGSELSAWIGTTMSETRARMTERLERTS